MLLTSCCILSGNEPAALGCGVGSCAGWRPLVSSCAILPRILAMSGGRENCGLGEGGVGCSGAMPPGFGIGVLEWSTNVSPPPVS